MLKVAAVGQTPPPHGGQTLMFGLLLSGSYEGVSLVHVPTEFSRELSDMGSFRFSKLLELCRVLYRIVRARVRYRADVLYYTPAAPFVVPVLRDLAILGATRWMFRATIFHFHAGGVSELRSRLPRPIRPLFGIAFDSPDIAIRTSRSAPEDGRQLRARVEFVVANGIEDACGDLVPHGPTSGPPVVLHVGLLCELKGILELVDACGQLKREGVDFRLVLAGPFVSREFAATLAARLDREGLTRVVELPGPVSGEEKWRLYREAQVFCFPTRHPQETFGVAAVEALCFGLPVVASRWRGLREVVDDGVCGLLSPPDDARELARALRKLIVDSELRHEFGLAARRRYLANYTLDKYRTGLQAVFDEVKSMLRRTS